MIGHKCYGIVRENNKRGQRFKRLATEVAFSQAEKSLQILNYNACKEERESVQEAKKLFLVDVSIEKKLQDHFLQVVSGLQKGIHVIRNTYVSEQPLESIVNNLSVFPLKITEEPTDDTINPSNAASIRSLKLVHEPILKTYLGNEYVERYHRIHEDIELAKYKKIEDDLAKEIEKYRTLLVKEQVCMEHIMSTYFNECELYKIEFGEKNLEYENENYQIDDEINSKKMLINTLQEKRKLMTKDMLRYRLEIRTMLQRLERSATRSEKSPRLKPLPSTNKLTMVTAFMKEERKKKKMKPKEPELVKFKEVKVIYMESKFENMKDLYKKHFGGKVKQKIQGKDIKKTLKMKDKENRAA